MLTYNFKQIFKARGIRNPATMLVKNGITYNIANRIAAGSVDKISLRIMEKVCRVLNCTPNDIYNFTPDNEADKSEHNALMALSKNDSRATAVQELLQTLPIEKLSALADLLNQKK